MDNAFRGMRNPLESHSLCDSYDEPEGYILGEKDLTLAVKLVRAGTEHRKFLRQIFVSVDITAPLYWWKEFDTYKVGTVANSTSTMHRLTSAPITWSNFEFDDMPNIKKLSEEDPYKLAVLRIWTETIKDLEKLRQLYVQTGDKFYWKELIRLLPSSWLQTRTVTMNYENLISMYNQRKNHKLTEWHQYCDWIETLPYTQTLFGIG